MKNKKPSWLKTRIPSGDRYFRLKDLLAKRKLSTICQDAKCPNISECWENFNATFLILNNVCTRDCSFCSVKYGIPQVVDPQEADHIVEMVNLMNLEYVVITSVTRDDLKDGGSSHFKFILDRLREEFPKLEIEILIPDFKGEQNLLHTVLDGNPDILNHNLETVESLYPNVNRKISNYKISLEVLRESKKKGFYTKSGIMLGLGENLNQIKKLLDDLIEAGVDLLTIGQYLQPTTKNIPVAKFYTPEEFVFYKDLALEAGFKDVESGHFVRSSYNAKKMYNKIRKVIN